MRQFIDVFERQRDEIRVACFSFSEFDSVPAQLKEKRFEKLGLTISEVSEIDQFKRILRYRVGRPPAGDLYKIDVLEDSLFYRLGLSKGAFLVHTGSFESVSDFLSGLESGNAPKLVEIEFRRFSNLVIEKIAKESPAAASGLKVNDAVLKVNGNDVPNAKLFMHHLVNKWKGPSKVMIERAGSALDLSLKLDSRITKVLFGSTDKDQEEKSANYPSFWHGITFYLPMAGTGQLGSIDGNSISLIRALHFRCSKVRGHN